MAISDNVRKIGEDIGLEIDKDVPGRPLATNVQRLAINAILGEAAARREYMDIFAESEEELAHLTATDDTDADRREARAYLFANGICGSGSTRRILVNVTERLNL